MLVEDPEDTIRALCHLRDSIIPWDTYKAEYEKIKKREKEPVDEKTVDTHFYTLGVFGFISSVEDAPSQYKITPIGRDACASLEIADLEAFKSKLQSVVLSNPDKGQLFEEFLDFVVKPISRPAIYGRFREIPARTLIAWCHYVGLVEVEGGMVWRLHLPVQQPPSDGEFMETLVQTYDEMQKTETPGIKRVFVDINEIRRNVCYKLKGLSVTEFDEYLRRILDGPEGKSIRLYGAPTSVYEERRNFPYKSRVYAYMSIGA